MSCISAAVSCWIASVETLQEGLAVHLRLCDGALGGDQPVRRLVGAGREEVGVPEFSVALTRMSGYAAGSGIADAARALGQVCTSTKVTLVIGAGQAGLSASYHLAGAASTTSSSTPTPPGGAWQHRWDSLTMHDVHGVADLPDAPSPGAGRDRANASCRPASPTTSGPRPAGVRPVRVDRVDERGRTAGRRRRGPAPGYPDARQRDRHLDAAVRAALPGHRDLRAASSCTPSTTPARSTSAAGGCSSSAAARRRCSSSASCAPVTETLWVTRREPVWRTDDFTRRSAARSSRWSRSEYAGAAAGQRRQRHRARAAPAGAEAERLGAYDGAGRCSPGSSRRACAGPTGPSSRST